MLTVPLPLPTMNELIAHAKRHWAHYAREKRIHSLRVFALARQARLPKIKNPVIITFRWFPSDRRTDLDNLASGGAKICLDSLVQAGVLPDDSPAWVRRLDHVLCNPDPDNPRVELHFCEFCS